MLQTYPDAMLAAFDAALILAQEQVRSFYKATSALTLQHSVVLGACCRVSLMQSGWSSIHRFHAPLTLP